MKACILWIALLIVIISCDQQVPAETTEPVDAPKEETIPTELEEKESIKEEEKRRPLAATLLGKIDHQYAIEVELYPTDGNFPKQACTPVEGSYHYTNQGEIMNIKGEWCPKDKSITLNRIKDGEAVEFFEGQVEGELASVQGTWKKGDKTLNFDLKNVITLPEYLLFVEALKGALAENPIAFVEDVGVDEESIYLVNPELGEYDFTATHFYSIAYYESTAVNVDQEIGVSFIKSSLTNSYIATSSRTVDTEDFPEGKEAGGEPVYSKDVMYAVYLYLNEQAVNVFAPSEKEATTTIYATLKNNKLTLIDKTTGKEEVLK